MHFRKKTQISLKNQIHQSNWRFRQKTTRWHFYDNKSLSRIEDFRYEIIAMNDVIRMKFFMFLKNKNEFISFMLNILNLIANQFNSRLKFFKINDVKKYKELISIFNVKVIFWEKIDFVRSKSKRRRWTLHQNSDQKSSHIDDWNTSVSFILIWNNRRRLLFI